MLVVASFTAAVPAPATAASCSHPPCIPATAALLPNFLHLSIARLLYACDPVVWLILYACFVSRPCVAMVNKRLSSSHLPICRRLSPERGHHQRVRHQQDPRSHDCRCVLHARWDQGLKRRAERYWGPDVGRRATGGAHHPRQRCAAHAPVAMDTACAPCCTADPLPVSPPPASVPHRVWHAVRRRHRLRVPGRLPELHREQCGQAGHCMVSSHPAL